MSFEPVDTSVEDILGPSWLIYAMETITDRAIPFMRDGCKPVQRRILYAMLKKMGLKKDASHAKVAEISGIVSGQFHPHGETSVNDAIFRLGQNWVMRYPLIDPQGNFGSALDPVPGAPRYSEARLTRAGELVLGDDELDPEIVPFVDTYNNKQQEPVYLPGPFPNALCNPQIGIAVAMACHTVSHNITEVCAALKAIAKNPDLSTDKLMKIIPGPDFPTGGYILGTEGIKEYYETGRGKVVIQGKVDIHTNIDGVSVITVLELPYRYETDAFIGSIVKAVSDKTLESVSDLRDLSDRNGMRIEIEIKKGVDPIAVLNKIYKLTNLRTSVSVNNSFIVDGRPATLSLKQMLQKHIEHRVVFIKQKCELELKKSSERIHLLDGFVKVFNNLDLVLKLVRGAADSAEAKQQLMKRKELLLSDLQATATMGLSFSQITKLSISKLKAETEALQARIKDLKKILSSHDRVLDLLFEELDEMVKQIGDPRRTIICTDKPEQISIQEVTQKEQVVVVVSKDGHIKRLPLSEFKNNKRSFMGQMTNKELSAADSVHVMDSHDELLVFTCGGSYYRISASQIKQTNRSDAGESLYEILGLDEAEMVAATVVDRLSSSVPRFVLTCSVEGLVKRTPLEEYRTKRSGGAPGLGLQENDELGWVYLTEGNSDLFLGTKNGYVVRFPETEIRPSGRPSTGVRGIKIEAGDELISCEVASPQQSHEVLTISENGIGKKTDASQYRCTKRSVRGVTTMTLDAKSGDLVKMAVVSKNDSLVLFVGGKPHKAIALAEIKSLGRAAKGVKIGDLGGNEVVDEVMIVREE